MASFPNISSGTIKILQAPLSNNAFMKYPSTLNFGYVTRRLKFLNDSEQRFTVRTVLFSASLSFSKLSGYDMSLLVDFFNQVRGGYTDPALLNVFSIVVSGNTYNYCVFDQDNVSVQSDSGETFSLQFNIKQVRPN